MIYFIDLIHVMVIEVKALSNVRSGWFPVLTLPENRHIIKWRPGTGTVIACIADDQLI